MKGRGRSIWKRKVEIDSCMKRIEGKEMKEIEKNS